MDIDKPSEAEPGPLAQDDKSLNHAVLKPRHASNVQKPQQKKKPLRRNQRLRVERGLQRAEIVMDQMERKVSHSYKKGKVIKNRSHEWQDINDAINPNKSGKPERDQIDTRKATGKNDADSSTDQIQIA
ncbi:MAG: hypothetical protein Q9162_002729 [Coniocarpon cinnabarinum]